MSRPTSNWLIELTRLSIQLRTVEEPPVKRHETVRPRLVPDEKKQTVVGGGIPLEPVNRQAAMLLCHGDDDWLANPNLLPPKKQEPVTSKKKQKKKKSKKGKHIMSKQEMMNIPGTDASRPGVGEVAVFGDYEIKGIRGANGELLFRPEDMQKVLMAMAKEMPKEIDPILPRAKDARAAVDELLDGLGHDMTEFKHQCTAFLEDIRQTRFSIVAETSQMSKPLREIRQFFLDKDYQTEVARLKEFVELCERLVELKRTGILDAVTDTMIKLAV